jgi:hypothetical protein
MNATLMGGTHEVNFCVVTAAIHGAATAVRTDHKPNASHRPNLRLPAA